MDITGATAITHNGRDTTLVFVLPGILSFSTILALVFICVNLFKPEIHDKTLMPALQSPWFAPHVIVYMFAYAVLGAAAVMAIYLLFIKKSGIAAEEFDITDNLVYVGLAFLTIGMLFGALWAKEAWGLSGYSSVRSSYCKCVGGASIISLPPKVRVYIHII